MKKLYKILFFVFLFFAVITIKQTVEANSINKISMDIYVDNKGDAHITEVWDCKASEGTEVYHPYYNLGNSKITNLTVSEGNNKYTTLSSWNTSGSLSSKAYKCGINSIVNGVEICWGISKYGTHTYTVKYTITHFVADLKDSQMIYWTLIPYEFSDPIGSVYIKIYSDFKISNSTDVWGYGNYGGTAYVYDGYIEMQSDGRLAKNEYMTILVKFPSETFNVTQNEYPYNFSHYLNMAEEGATKYKEERTADMMENIIPFVVMFFIMGTPILGIVGAIATASETNFGPEGKKFSKDTPYFRDIPCNGDLFKAYYIAEKYQILSKKTDLLGAIILKWIKESKVRIEQKEQGTIFKKENTVVILNETNPNEITNIYERQIFDMLYKASQDGVLENKELERWCKNNYTKILKWFEDIISSEEKKLIEEGLITVEKVKKLKVFTAKQYNMTLELRKMAEEIYGLKKYLLEYTLIPDRKAVEVALFEEYLVFAQMLGIAKHVAKEFKDLYPEVIAESHFTSYDYILFVNMTSSDGIGAAKTAKARAESYSSGGGGFSSGGGGGGSFGGGGGGGGFR